MTTGLSGAMIISAYKVSDGVQEGLVVTAKSAPEVFMKPFSYLAYVLLALLLFIAWPVIRVVREYVRRHCRKTECDKND